MSLQERANGHGSSIRTTDWTLVVPVKPAAIGKSRLAPFAGKHRMALARAMALDTVNAALACRRVAEVIAVTQDPESGAALAAFGAIVVGDEPDAGLNAALLHGATRAWERRPGCPVGAMLGDLPALRPEELALVLDKARDYSQAFVPDADGVGTTLYCATERVGFTPRFGGSSSDAHRASGAVELALPDAASVRRDVDTEGDLMAALALGVGPRTRAAVAFLL